MNLLEETKQILEEHGLNLDDVDWIGSEDVYIDKEKFIELANVEYDPGFGGAEVVEDLMLVGKDFYLERGEYDGSEWWEFKQVPKRPKEKYVPLTLVNGAWTALQDINERYKRHVL